jgi:hypothetical protein
MIPSPVECEATCTEKDLGRSHRFRIGHIALALALGVTVYRDTQSVSETALIALFGFVPHTIAVGVLLMAGIGAFNGIWRRFQPDHRQFVEYTRALASYRLGLFRWLRLQDFWWQTLDG